MADANYTKYRALEDFFKEHFAYDAASGSVTWKQCRRPSRIRVGDEAGCTTKDGYRQACIGTSTSVYLHLVAWFLHYGEWPNGVVDHINGIRSDNRVENLRVVSHAANIQNQRRANKRNKLGVLGVSAAFGRYRAAIRLRGKGYQLGTFDTAEEAYAAYVDAKRRLHDGCTL